jgi:H+/gluconate symporter-like permease
VGQQVLSKELLKRLGDIPGITAQLIRSSGATEILKLVPKASHDLALNAYNASLRTVFQVGLILACIEILGAATMEWRKAKPKFPPKQKKGEESAADAGEKEAQSESAETLSAHASSPVEPVKSGDNRE